VVAAFAVIAIVLVATGHNPLTTYDKLFDEAFLADGALSQTFVSATPLLFTGLAAAVAFRMNLFNIGAEGQLYVGAVFASAAGLVFGGQPAPVVIGIMVVAGIVGGALWGLIPGVLRAYLRTNEILTSLMLNYVALYVLYYLIFDSLSYWRDTSTPDARVFPQGKFVSDAATWPAAEIGGVTIPLGFLLGVGAAGLTWALYQRTRFGFEVAVIGDSPRAGSYAGMRTRRTIVAVMALSGAIAGIGGASQIGDFSHQLDPRGLEQAYYGYTGIVVAALARYNPFAVVLVAFLLGGLNNAGYALQGPDFPSGLVGVMQGVILFCVLGGEILVRYRVRLVRRPPPEPAPAAPSPPVEAS
jgi:simple sugar transport system permease protein